MRSSPAYRSGNTSTSPMAAMNGWAAPSPAVKLSVSQLAIATADTDKSGFVDRQLGAHRGHPLVECHVHILACSSASGVSQSHHGGGVPGSSTIVGASWSTTDRNDCPVGSAGIAARRSAVQYAASRYCARP